MPNVVYVSGLFKNTYNVEPHSHKTYELVYYTEGSGLVTIGNNKIQIKKGIFILIAPEVQHADSSEEGFQNLHLNILKPNLPVNEYLVLEDTENKDILRIFKNIHFESHIKRKNWVEVVDALYNVLYQYIISMLSSSIGNPYVNKIIRDIINNISNPHYSLKDSIEKLPFNPNYFRGVFLKETGLAPTQFLIKKRIDYAKELINTKNLSMYSFENIANLCGYEDSAYFSRLFKKYVGQSPKKWNNNLKT